MKEEENNDVEIKWVDGMPCIVAPDGTFTPKDKKPRVMVYRFGNLQELRESNTIPDIVKELNEMFNRSVLNPRRIKLPKEKEDKKDVNKEREREDTDQI